MLRTRILSLILALAMLMSVFALSLAEDVAPVEELEAAVEEIPVTLGGDEGEPLTEDEAEVLTEDEAEALTEDEAETESDDENVIMLGEEAEVVSEPVEAEDAGTFSGYALMNIPFGEFFSAIGASGAVDAVSAATNKVGNYGKAGGAFHSVTTYGGLDAEGKPVAVGGDNGAKLEGVIWAVHADSLETITAKGGSEITADSKVTVATLGKGQSTKTDLTGAACLMEAPKYSYFLLDAEPANYLNLSASGFTMGSTQATGKGNIDVPATYGGHHADVTLGISAAKDVADKLINAVVLTTSDGDTALLPLYQVWSASEIGWNYKDLSGLTNKKITGIRAYCSTKAGEAYANYVYDYVTDVTILPPFEGAITAEFESASSLALTGLSNDIQNLKAKVTTGRGASAVSLTGDDPVAVTNGKIALSAAPVDGTTYNVALTSDNYSFKTVSVKYSRFNGYALMNIPFDVFYKAIGATSADVDAVSAATNKVGNYGKAGGAYHSVTTYGGVDAEGKPVAVGGANGAKLEGVIWPVYAETLEEITGKGGTEITNDSKVTVATVGRGQASKTDLTGYACLMEAPAYSYYLLDTVPTNCLNMVNGVIAGPGMSTQGKGNIDVPVSYGGHHAEVTLGFSAATDVADKLINAVVLTAADGDTALLPLYQIWSASEIGWNYKDLNKLTGKTITGITAYCSTKAGQPYANYIYDYSTNVFIAPTFDGAITAAFADEKTLTLTGLPADVKNLKARVSWSAGRGSTPVYLTGDAPVAVSNGKIALSAAPEDSRTYTVALTADNYGFNAVSAAYTAPTIIEANKSRTVNIYLGTNYQIRVTGGSLKSCVRRSGKAASVTADGLVIPEKLGTSRVQVTPEKGKKFTLTLKVLDPTIPAKVVFAEGKKITVNLGEPIQLNAIVEPATADQKLSWKSAKKYIATVDDSGLVTPVNVGKVTITATTGNKKKASITVTVVNPKLPTSVAIRQGKTATVKLGSTLQLDVVILPDTADKVVTWKSSNNTRATVDANGLVTAKKTGKVKVTATTGNKKKATITLNIVK